MRKRKGRASTELILAMVLLILFSAATLTLVSSGTDVYSATTRVSDANSSLRVAASYIYTRARQSMEAGSIRVAVYDSIDGNCLVMRQSIEGVPYETVIFIHEGFLKESLIPMGGQPEPDSSFEIVELSGFMLEEDDRGIQFNVLLETDELNSAIEGYISKL